MRDKQSGRLRRPGYDALNELLGVNRSHRLCAGAHRLFAGPCRAAAPQPLALDGKSVGHGRCGMIITLCRHEDGRPVAMAMTVARGKKEDTSQRLAGATQALKETPIFN